jgi:GDPmannose 4,6-dehydratase
VHEQGVDARSGKVLVEVDPRYFRPTDVELLIGDPAKARAKLGWKHKVSLDELVTEMAKADLEELRRSMKLSSKATRSTLMQTQ